MRATRAALVMATLAVCVSASGTATAPASAGPRRAAATGAVATEAAAAKAVRPPHLSVTGASLIDAATGRRLFGVHANAELPIASTTKLMTALITLQHIHRLGTIFTQNNWRAAPADSQIGLAPGERMSVHDLLIALLLPSADDAAEDLAYNVGHHSVSRFVAMMNAEARALHLRRTHYSTPIGLDTPGNYSTPTDLDLLAAYDLHHSAFFRRVVNMSSATLYTGRHQRYVVNMNDLVGRYWWINGVKSGHTSAAGYVLVVSGTRWGMTLIGSVLGTSSQLARDDNALALLHYGFSAFHLDRAIRVRQVLARLPEQNSGQRAPIVALHPFKYVVAKTTRLKVVLRLPKQLTGPLAARTVVGRALIYIRRHRVGQVRLILAKPVPAASPVTKAELLPLRPITLLLLVLVCAAALVAHGMRGVRRTQRGHDHQREADPISPR